MTENCQPVYENAETISPLTQEHHAGPFALPDFARLEALSEEGCLISTMAALITEIRESIETLVNDHERSDRAQTATPAEPTWESFIEPLSALEDRLNRAWSPLRHLHSVKNSAALRDAHSEISALLSDHGTALSQHRGLFRLYESLRRRADQLNLDLAQIKLLDDALTGFRLAGVDRDDATRERLKAINAELSRLTTDFENHVLDATQQWVRPLTGDDIAGLPDDERALLAQNASRRNQKGYLATLDYPSYAAVMTYAENRDLRAEVYRAFATRASDQADTASSFDNGPLMLKILKLRAEKAALTGFSNYTERSLATKMADSLDQIEGFLLDLATKARPHAERELDDLASRATADGIDQLEPWDQAFYAEKIRRERFALNQEELRQYFPAEAVIDGLFKQVERLFGVNIRPSTLDVAVYDPDVRFYEVRDPDGGPRAGFYLDLYARQNKRGGAWMDVCRTRRRGENGIELPVAYMTCNSTPPVGDKPALLTHDEVITLFHEFGHGLHHMLTEIDHPDISGIAGVEWDAVELPSQFMENWCWQRTALDDFARHWKTGEPMPEDLFQRLLATRHFHEALQTLRQCEFALFDLRLHSGPPPEDVAGVLAILDQVRNEVAVIRPPSWHRFPHAFSHIFAGGYAAGYYSYKWAEVLSADAFSRFEEEGLDNPEIGQAFRREILAVGASRPAMDSFIAFRGREPNVEALLRHTGLTGAAA